MKLYNYKVENYEDEEVSRWKRIKTALIWVLLSPLIMLVLLTLLLIGLIFIILSLFFFLLVILTMPFWIGFVVYKANVVNVKKSDSVNFSDKKENIDVVEISVSQEKK